MAKRIRTITENAMRKAFASKYPKLYADAGYIHQADGLCLYAYYDDGSYMVYDYEQNRITKIMDPDINSNKPSPDYDYKFIPFENNEELKENISRNLKWIMRQKKITSKELSEKTKIPYNSLRRYVNGEIVPSLYNLCSICSVLNVSVEYIIS